MHHGTEYCDACKVKKHKIRWWGVEVKKNKKKTKIKKQTKQKQSQHLTRIKLKTCNRPFKGKIM